jgi:hypothetical protein
MRIRRRVDRKMQKTSTPNQTDEESTEQIEKKDRGGRRYLRLKTMKCKDHRNISLDNVSSSKFQCLMFHLYNVTAQAVLRLGQKDERPQSSEISNEAFYISQSNW